MRVTLISSNFRRAKGRAESLNEIPEVSPLIIGKSGHETPISEHESPLLCISPAN